MKVFIPTEDGTEMIVFRTRAERRHNSVRKALRKKRITEEVYIGDFQYYKSLHQYSKNKIHCSCPRCAAKVRPKNLVYSGKKYNPTIAMMRKIEGMDFSEKDFFREGGGIDVQEA